MHGIPVSQENKKSIEKWEKDIGDSEKGKLKCLIHKN